MVKEAQKWFDKKYPNKKKKETNKITLNDNIEGSLKIEGFTKLKGIKSKKIKLTSLEINNCPQLTKIDFSEPAELRSLSVSDCPGITKLDFSHGIKSKLTSLEINNCSQLSNIDLSELTELKDLFISDCPGITKLDLSQSKLTELTELKVNNLIELGSISLDGLKFLTLLEISNCHKLNKINLSELIELKNLSISDCPRITELDFSELEASNIIELNCSNTSIEKLSLNLCPNITKLICSNNEKLIYLDITNCSKLETLTLDNKSKLTSLDLSNCPKIKDDDLPSNLKIIREQKIKNILIIGRTGGGKSTLSNVLTGTDEFEESASAFSATKNFQKKVFEWPDTTDTTKTADTTKYRVVDTIGVGDTKLNKRQVLYKIAEGIYSMPEGISQVLFVIHGRFTAEEIESFKLFGESIFENGVLKYTTIVKTKFVNFKNKEECEKEREKLLQESEAIADVIKSCRDIVFVDNPPTKMIINDNDDIETVNNNKRVRKKSRELLLEYLGNIGQEKFKLKMWDETHAKIVDYINKNSDKKITEDTESLIDENSPEIQPLLIFGTKICSIL